MLGGALRSRSRAGKRSGPSEGGEVDPKDFQRYRPVVFEVAREIDSGHAAAAGASTLEHVAVVESFGELGRDVSHVGGLRRASFKSGLR